MLADFIVNVEKDYTINRKPLGEGNFGIVYEGTRKRDGTKVAVKKLKDANLDLNNQKSLVRELSILSSLHHPNCLSLIGFALEPEIIIITPFMPNGSLEDALVAKFDGKPGFEKFTATKRMCSFYGLCSVMSYIHSKNIIHRDFKPENIFLNKDYEVCIADFGLSRAVCENVYLTRGTLGSPVYMAPDIYGDDEVYTNAVDVYSFGVTLYHYFVKNLINLDDGKGKIKSKTNLLSRIMKGARLIKDPNIPENYFNIYKRCVEHNPSLRPSFDELAEMFEKEEDLILEGVNKDEYYEYIDRCKKTIEDLNSNKNVPDDSSLLRSSKKAKGKLYF
ncbi:hypothetical protein M9Y10_028602 [Tritrichomonas musculus]|uniref:Protein kinase domain-containing protein n=1 Tax=Tritrichomonas musculus TaxID=1915356 RepID=A0ABR2KJZ6_9EUKA